MQARAGYPALFIGCSTRQFCKRLDQIETTVREIAGDSKGIIGLIDQWKADVEADRSVERKLRVRQSPDVDGLIEAPRSRSKTSGDFVGKENFTNTMQLDMLIDALGLAFLAPFMMSERLLDTIENNGGEQDRKGMPDPVIHFEEVATTDTSHAPPRISRATIAQSKEATAEVAILLSEIIRETGFTPRRLIDGEDGA